MRVKRFHCDAGCVRVLAIAMVCFAGARPTSADWIWVEGEKPAQSTMHRHPWFDQVKRDVLSGGELISNFAKEPGEASYAVAIKKSGDYEFWIRANPVQARLSFQVDGSAWRLIDLEKDQRDSRNIAADGKIDLRYLAWARVGSLALERGDHVFRFRMDGSENNHGYIDCFILTDEAFRPDGSAKPDQQAALAVEAAKRHPGWFVFDPKPDPFSDDCLLDLRALNEPVAGAGGFIGTKDGQFIHGDTAKPVRFWAVNGPPGKDPETLKREARLLAKRGVNLVRVHHPYFDKNGNVDPAEVQHAIDIAEAMKAEGIYSYYSIYFPLWLTPSPGTAWLKGYDGKKNPFAALFFNTDFQEQYRSWWKALLTTPNPTTGKRLVDDPAVAGLEILNEDSYLFWTFNPDAIPDVELRIVETQFGSWLKAKYGTLDAALRAWNGQRLQRDAPAQGRMAFRPLWNLTRDRNKRDQDTARFLTESQRAFYKHTYDYLRDLGFKGVITASNWYTASPELLGPLEKYTYSVGDFIDRHGYFGCAHAGDNAAWSVREGHTFSDRSALRFEAEGRKDARAFVHPVMDPSYDGKPSMISETTFNRPNRFRSEAPLFYATFGALQDSDAIVHFALDTTQWSVKPGFFMQPWTLMSPAMMGQFPAAALLFRKSLIRPGDVLVELNLKLEDLVSLKGTPLPQDASFDVLRAQDLPKGASPTSAHRIDPLVHFAGRTNVRFSKDDGRATVRELKPWIDRKQRIVSSTSGQLKLDYGRGLLVINAPSAQGLSGALGAAGTTELADVTISSPLELGHVVAVSLDDQPLATSRAILLQVMTEEKPSDFQTEPAPGGKQRIINLGHDPWLVREIKGSVQFKRADASRLCVHALDPNGYPVKTTSDAGSITLDATTIYYVITP